MGLTLDVIGKLGAVGVVTGPLCLLLLAGRVDRWHPVRIQAYTLAYATFFAFGSWVWLFVMTPNPLRIYRHARMKPAVYILGWSDSP